MIEMKVKKVTIKVTTEDDVIMERSINAEEAGNIISSNALKDKYLHILSELKKRYTKDN